MFSQCSAKQEFVDADLHYEKNQTAAPDSVVASKNEHAYTPALQTISDTTDIDTTPLEIGTVNLIGKIEIADDSCVYLITKWTSRSKKTYLIIGDKRDIIAKYKDRIISANCIIKEKKAWSGTIDIINFKAVNGDGNTN